MNPAASRRRPASSRPEPAASRAEWAASRPGIPDIAVIGGGIAGTATAALLARAGLRVRLYERTAIAAGASGRNSGVVQHPFDPVLADLYRRTLAVYARLAELTDRAFALPPEPAGLLFIGHDTAAARAAAQAWSATWPATRPEVLEDAALRAAEPAVAAGLAACRLEMGYPVAPAAATEAFATLARTHDVEIRIGGAASVAVDGGRIRGVRVGGVVEPAGGVVVAAGPWTPKAIDPTDRWRPIEPIWGVVAAVALDRPPRHGLEAIDINVEPAEASRGSADPGRERRPALDGPPSPDDDLVEFSLAPGGDTSALGSTFLPREPEPAAWLESLRRVGARYVPAVSDAPVAGVRHCARPLSRDGRPLVGRAPWADRLWVIAGHGPWGISTGPGSAELLVAGILGTDGDGTVTPELRVDRFGVPPDVD